MDELRSTPGRTGADLARRAFELAAIGFDVICGQVCAERDSVMTVPK